MAFPDLSSLFFVTPWMLLALLLLPLLWFLLRVTPPQPKQVSFPATRFVEGLEGAESKALKTPWWLLLLRLLIAALVVLALAGPILSKEKEHPITGAIFVVVDNDWSSGRRWENRQEIFDMIVELANRYSQKTFVLASAENDLLLKRPRVQGPLGVREASLVLNQLTPQPWQVQRAELIEAIRTSAIPNEALEIFWLAGPLAYEGDKAFADELRALGRVTLFEDSVENSVAKLMPPQTEGNSFVVPVQRLTTGQAEELVVAAFDRRGYLVSESTAVFEASVKTANAVFDLPSVLRNRIASFSVPERATSGAVHLLDKDWVRRPVGILAKDKFQAANALLTSKFYLQTAMNPFANVRAGTVGDLLEKELSVMFWADDILLNQQERTLLAQWVESGGMLVRFAGPNLLKDPADLLLPTPLRRAGRQLGGAMTWEQPASIAAFTSKSPFSTLKADDKIRIFRQVLAVPSPELSEKTWARLEDGTPVVTAAQSGQGQLVLFHTSANPTWSDLALSGQFVDLLQLVVRASKGVQSKGQRTVYPPWKLVNGLGEIINSADSDTALIVTGEGEPSLPLGLYPGLYGTQAEAIALNLNSSLGELEAFDPSLTFAERRSYDRTEQLDLKPWLLLGVILLLLFDLLIRFALQGVLSRVNRKPVAAALAIALVSSFVTVTQEAAAQEHDPIDAILITRLAFVETGDPKIDAGSKAGLFGLSLNVVRRTAIDLGIPLGLDLEVDELSPFPLLYWPITPQQKSLSEEAVERINRYLRNGGLILFDTRDANLPSGAVRTNGAVLKKTVQNLAIPSLGKVESDHVLGRTFFLLDSFPGRWIGGDLWAIKQSDNSLVFGEARVNDSVSSVVIGSNDWAGAWALDQEGRPLFPAVPGGERQRELAFRFGINLVMYALAGNYKADQVHVEAILKRLGADQPASTELERLLNKSLGGSISNE
jgi:hypothetical protein